MIVDIKKKNTKINKYLDIATKHIKTESENLILKKLEELFKKSLYKRINLGKDFGVFLSGGLDSTLILYFASMFSKSTIDTYTINLPGDKYYASLISNFFKTKSYSRDISINDIIRIAPKAIWYLENFPTGIDTFHYFLAKMLRKKKYVFLGQYSEKLFFCGKDFILLKHLNSLGKIIRIPYIRDVTRLYINIKKLFPTKLQLYSLRRIRQTVNHRSMNDILNNYSYVSIVNGYLSDTYYFLDNYHSIHFLTKTF